MADLLYNGTELIAKLATDKKYNATSGLPGYQNAEFQKMKDKGPIPEGKYYILLLVDKKPFAQANYGSCSLLPTTSALQQIPRGANAIIPSGVPLPTVNGLTITTCDGIWANWGWNRIVVNVYAETNAFGRNGFYLHDSAKGYSHGCIEVDIDFFTDLRKFIKNTTKKKLNLEVKYPNPKASTLGKTKK